MKSNDLSARDSQTRSGHRSRQWVVGISTALVGMASTSTAFAWSGRWSASCSDCTTRTKRHEQLAERVHNYVMYAAMLELQRRGKLPFPMNAEADPTIAKSLGPTDLSDYTPFELMAYGNWYADHVWAGPPENPELELTEVNTSLNGIKYDDDIANEGGSDAYFRTTTQWTKGWITTGLNSEIEQVFYPNLFMSARFRLLTIDESQNLYQVDAGDNYYHYLLDTGSVSIADTSEYLDGNQAFAGTTLGADTYGATLFGLARDFSPDSASAPDATKLPYVTSGGLYGGPGAIKGDIRDIPFADDTVLEAKFPSLFVGANPFICVGGASDNPCSGGRATWPLWVPDPNLTSNASAFKAVLLDAKPDKSWRDRYIYLGWALHMLGDLSQPNHARNETGSDHKKLEDTAETVLAAMRKDNTLPTVSLSSVAWLSQSELCDDFPMSDESSYKALLLRVANAAKKYHVHASELTAPVLRDLLKPAIEATAHAIACFTDQLDVRYETIKDQRGRYSGDTVSVREQVVVQDGGKVEFSAKKRVTLGPLFQAKAGSNVRVYIE